MALSSEVWPPGPQHAVLEQDPEHRTLLWHHAEIFKTLLKFISRVFLKNVATRMFKTVYVAHILLSSAAVGSVKFGMVLFVVAFVCGLSRDVM